MPGTSLPRYFVAREGAAERSAQPDDLAPEHLVDTFLLAPGFEPVREWVVATDILGRLVAIPDERWGELDADLRAELAYHEVGGGRRRRRVTSGALFLFDLELLEQPADAGGWNDPVYLYGTLYGPYPSEGAGTKPGVEGQLTLTRCEMIDGLVRGAEYAFRIATRTEAAEHDARCLHAIVPGDADEATRTGLGIVLAYALPPPELSADGVANEYIASRLLFDLLGALQRDLERERIDHPLRSRVLPVPSRFILEQELRGDGYEIEGDSARKTAGSGEGLRGRLASMLGALVGDTVALPPEADVFEFLAIARQALDQLPGWPSPRAAAVRACTAPAVANTAAVPPAPPRPPKAPEPRPSPPPPRRPTPPPHPVKRGDEVPAWMRDFLAAHREPGSAPPTLTPTRAPGGGARSTTRAPEWMTDFAPARDRKPSDEVPKPAAEADPDWMKDFT